MLVLLFQHQLIVKSFHGGVETFEILKVYKSTFEILEVHKSTRVEE